jgi:hypothetical protein
MNSWRVLIVRPRAFGIFHNAGGYRAAASKADCLAGDFGPWR